MAIVTAFGWGCLPIIMKASFVAFSPMTIAAGRMVIAFFALLLLLQFKKHTPIKTILRFPLYPILAGVFLSVNYFGFTQGVFSAGASTAAALIQLAALLFIILGVFVFKEKISTLQIVGIAITFTGLMVFIRDQRVDDASGGNYFFGVAVVLLAAFAWSVYACFQKIASRNMTPQSVNVVVFLVAAIVLLPFADLSQITNASVGYLALLFIMGINTLIAYGALAEAIHNAPATLVGIIIVTNPLLTLVLLKILDMLDVTWFPPERLSTLGYIGALAIVIGVGIATTKAKQAAELEAIS